MSEFKCISLLSKSFFFLTVVQLCGKCFSCSFLQTVCHSVLEEHSCSSTIILFEKKPPFFLLVVLFYQLTRKRFTSVRCLVLNLFTLPLQQGPDYRLYKSEPELTTVTEVDENNGEDRSEHQSEHSGNKGTRGQNHHRNLMTSAQFLGKLFIPWSHHLCCLTFSSFSFFNTCQGRPTQLGLSRPGPNLQCPSRHPLHRTLPCGKARSLTSGR